MKKISLICLISCGLNLFAQKHLPAVSLKNLNGETVSVVSNFQEKDKVYVFCFWATWCSPCIHELDDISSDYADWKSKINMELVAISVDDSRTTKRVKPLVNGKGWEYTVLLDTNQELKRGLTIANVPHTVIVKNNEIVFVKNGELSKDELFEKLKSL